jgi:hypothetical protein
MPTCLCHRSCNQDFTRRVREFLTNCEHVHGKAPPPVSTEVIAGPKAFIDQCELLARWGLWGVHCKAHTRSLYVDVHTHFSQVHVISGFLLCDPPALRA